MHFSNAVDIHLDPDRPQITDASGALIREIIELSLGEGRRNRGTKQRQVPSLEEDVHQDRARGTQASTMV